VPELSISRRQALVGALVLGVVLLLAGKLLLRAGTSSQARPIPPPARVSAAPAATPKLFVDVVGAVRRPGLYRLADGARVADAVARAGGATPKADLESINLAAPIADGQQIAVPRKAARGAPAVAAAAPASASGTPDAPVSLSTATLAELDALPGVGPVTAQKILDYREQHGALRSVEELDAIPGIGPARLEQLRGLLVP
jgi:competence protein ComEA